MSLEVYVINLVIAVVTFFILKRTLKKIIKADERRILITWIGTLVLTPLIYFTLIIVFFSMLFYEPTRDFDRARWLADKHKRFEMRDDIVESGLLKGKSKKQVIDLIGRPDFATDTTDRWTYDLGTSGAGFGWQFNSLLVTFDNGRVESVEKQEIVD
jgi:hypothetical protein